MKLTIPDQFDQLCQWMDYRQFATIDDLFDTFHKDPDKLDTKGPVTEYEFLRTQNTEFCTSLKPFLLRTNGFGEF